MQIRRSNNLVQRFRVDARPTCNGNHIVAHIGCRGSSWRIDNAQLAVDYNAHAQAAFDFVEPFLRAAMLRNRYGRAVARVQIHIGNAGVRHGIQRVIRSGECIVIVTLNSVLAGILTRNGCLDLLIGAYSPGERTSFWHHSSMTG